MYRLIGSAGVVLLVSFPVVAQVTGPQQSSLLTLDAALQRAQESAPAVVAARMRIDEARGHVLGASLLFSSNPAVEVGAGPRSGGTSATDYAVEVGQELEFPQRRRGRVDAARAGVTQEEQRAREVERETLRGVAETFLRALEARERAAAATSGERLAEEALQIAERRYAAGDVAQLDVNLARASVARAIAEARVAAAAFTGHTTRLQVLLGITETVTPAGSLRDAVTLATGDLLTRAADRPDVRLLEAEIAEAEAAQRLAQTLRWPDFSVRASWAREGADRVLLGGVGITLPLVQRGQEAMAIANARLSRLRVEREALARTLDAEVRGGLATYEALRAATIAYEQTVLPLVEENEKLALESYEVGQIGLADLLLVRREALDARRVFIDQLIETRLAEVELRALAGVWK